MNRRILVAEHIGKGWETSFQIKRGGTTRIHTQKDIAKGLVLRQGNKAYGYLLKDLENNRMVIAFYIDGKERDGEAEKDDRSKRN